MKVNIFLFAIFILFSKMTYGQKEEAKLNDLINAWHVSAAKADFKKYFEVTAENFVFLGTAPGERWKKSRISSVL